MTDTAETRQTPAPFVPGRKSLWADQAPIMIDGELMDIALQAAERLSWASHVLLSAVTMSRPGNLDMAQRSAREGFETIAQLRSRLKVAP